MINPIAFSRVTGAKEYSLRRRDAVLLAPLPAGHMAGRFAPHDAKKRRAYVVDIGGLIFQIGYPWGQVGPHWQ